MPMPCDRPDCGYLKPEHRISGGPAIDDAMVSRALRGFDTGVGDPNDYRKRMRAALEAALDQ